LAWLVVAVDPVVKLLFVDVPLAVLSNGLTATNPATESALAALLVTEAEKVTVIVSLVVKAAVIGAEKRSVLTFVVFAMLTSWV
jgi:hypothetical protein